MAAASNSYRRGLPERYFMYEVLELEGVFHPVPNPKAWDPAFIIYTWYTEQKDGYTVIYGNFHGKNPNEENVEINVRQHCFYPEETGKTLLHSGDLQSQKPPQSGRRQQRFRMEW